MGDEAYRKCTARELQNQRLIRSLEVEGVGLILTAIIDYKGQRIIGQSILPGIFAQVRALSPAHRCSPGIAYYSISPLYIRTRARTWRG